jgi:hypothetical protein
MEEDCKYHTKPLKFKTWKLQEKTLSRDINTHNLNITGEEMTLWEKKYQDAFPNLLLRRVC